MKTERLQKILARGGLASRRSAESLITEGRVRVNGVIVTELGAKADPMKDKVEVDGKRVIAEDPVYVLLHKERGVVSTMSDPEGRPTVAEPLSEVRSANGKAVRMYPVGRLDFATSGALLATNDGAFADALLHPREGVPKTYVVKVSGVMKEEDLDQWRNGVMLEDGITLPAKLSLLRHEEGKTWLELTIREGRNQQIRRMGEATHYPVMRLARTSFAGVTTEGLPPGRWRMLTREELMDLKKTYGVPRRIPAGAPMIMGDRSGRTPRGRSERAERGETRLAATHGRAERAERPRGPNTHLRREEPVAGRVRTGEAARGRGVVKEEPARGGRSNRFGRSDRTERSERGGRGAPEASAEGTASAPGRGTNFRARAQRSSGPAPHAPAGSRGHGSSSSSSPTQGARYGGGSPGRRSYEVREDWGGGSERGRSPSGDGGSNNDAPARGRSGGGYHGGHGPGGGGGGTGRGSSGYGQRSHDGGGAPREDLGGGRFGRTRTTGTAGGIGARADISSESRTPSRAPDRTSTRGPARTSERSEPRENRGGSTPRRDEKKPNTRGGKEGKGGKRSSGNTRGSSGGRGRK